MPLEPGPLASLVQRLKADVGAGQLPGAVLRVLHRGRCYGAHLGWLDAQRRVPMRDDAIFRIFSMTKPLTSVVAMQLVEEGHLALGTRLGDCWPDLPWQPPARTITVRDLMRHTAGYTYGARCPQTDVSEAYAREGVLLNPRGLPVEDFMRAMARVPLLHPPGERWEYGHSTDVLGALLEAVTGQRLGDLMVQRIFKPLGMVDSGFDCRASALHRVAQPLALDPTDGAPFLDPDQTYDASLPARMDSGGAGALSTAADYLRFAGALLAIARGVPCSETPAASRPLLDRASLALMTRDHLGPEGVATPVEPGMAAFQSPGYGFGLGFAMRLPGVEANLPGAPGFFFWSGTAGTLFWVDPAHDLAAVYMSQAPGANRQQYRRLVIQGVYEGLGLTGCEAPPPISPLNG